jgi:hypothetical protein
MRLKKGKRDSLDFELLCRTMFEGGRNSLQSQVGALVSLGSDKQYYAYIPSYSEYIARLLKYEISKIPNIENLSFLDAGAGMNTIPKIMKIMGFFNSKGLEYQDLYVKMDQNWLFQGDILTYDFKDWDIIYSYNPIKDTKLMCKGIDNIINTMKVGSIFYFLEASNAGQHLISKGGVRCKFNGQMIKYIKTDN